MVTKSKCYLFFVVIFCVLIITVGLMFNVFTIALIPSCKVGDTLPSCIPQRMQHTMVIKIVEGIGKIVEEIGEKVPKFEMPALVWIILLDLSIILSAMVPKMTFDRCKTIYFEGRKDWDDVAFLASVTVSF